MADDRIEIEISLDDGSVRRGFANIKGAAEDSAKGASTAFSGLTKSLVGLAAAYVSISAVKNLFSNAISEAIQADNSVNRLNNSLRLAGLFSEQSSQAFQNLASEIQKTTTISDDAVLSVASLALNYSKTTAQAEQLTKAAIDLAAATGVDVDTAVKQLGGTLSGTAGQLGKLVPEVKSLTKAQLEAGDAVDIIASRFSGAAGGALNSFGGRLENLGNIISDFFEVLGGIVTQSPAAIAVIGFISRKIVDLTTSLSEFSRNRDFVGAFVSTLVDMGQAFVKYLLAPAELTFNILKTGFLAIVSSFTALVADVVGVAGKLISFIAPESELAKGITGFAQQASSAFESTKQSLNESAANTFTDFSFSDASSRFLGELQATVDSAAPLGQQLANNVKNPLNEASTAIKDQFKSINEAYQQGLLKAISGGITSVVTAVAKGKNAFSTFGSAIFGIFGDMAIQIGTTLVGIGIGIEAIRASIIGLTGGPALAAGVALIALGALLKSLSGGGSQGETSGGVATGPGGGFVPTEPVTDPSQSIQEKEQKVVVNVQGDVLDSKETGLRIVDILNDAFNSQGAKVLAT